MSQESAKATTLLDLEEKLASDADGQKLHDVRSRIEAYSDELKRRMDAGLPPDEYEEALKLSEALETAVKVVENAWRRLHN